MTILFEKEEETIYAVAYDAILNGYQHDELMYAEVDVALGGFMVRFEDSWATTHHFATLQEAKDFILKTYFRHTPRSMGRNYFLN